MVTRPFYLQLVLKQMQITILQIDSALPYSSSCAAEAGTSCSLETPPKAGSQLCVLAVCHRTQVAIDRPSGMCLGTRLSEAEPPHGSVPGGHLAAKSNDPIEAACEAFVSNAPYTLCSPYTGRGSITWICSLWCSQGKDAGDADRPYT